ncbi:GcrA cell cycle regulator [Mesorhizobium amorphae]|uniref:GcrA cell cycle regulator n=1 Tax=Mesorhizobium amorphae TaxID=71433 RepID=UPI001FEF823B|nr:GcrA cell cycle regulator [Mesorhizobium amorphae]
MAAAYTDTELNAIALWLKDGLSATRIALRFSALRGSPVSRNAIIGIVHRNAGLRAIGFASPRGGRSGGRPRKNAARPAGRRATGQAKLSGQARQSGHSDQPRQAGPAGQARASGQAEGQGGAGTPFPPAGVVTVRTPEKPKQGKPRKPARALPPAWLSPHGLARDEDKPDALRYKLPAPPPPLPPGRQPHVAAMRFIDCLFGRCRAPLDLTLEEDPDKDAPGARPAPDMLCCGLRTSATRSYCRHHHARFHGRRRTLLAAPAR